jgi:hypothetical protein
MDVPTLADRFKVRQQRVMAIVALKQKEEEAQAAGETLHTELAGAGWPTAAPFELSSGMARVGEI